MKERTPAGFGALLVDAMLDTRRRATPPARAKRKQAESTADKREAAG